MKTRRPAVDKALQELTALLNSGTVKPGDCLPSVRQLSQDFGVSTVSMSRAIQHLKRTGVLDGARRIRSTVARDGNVPAFGTMGELGTRRGISTPASRIESELRREILLGEIGQETPLPSLKELQIRFRASHVTVRAALGRLYENGLIQTGRRWYCVKDLGRPKANARVALIGFSLTPDHAIIRAAHDTYLCSLLHTQVWKKNLLLDQVCCPRGPHAALYGPNGRPYVFDENVIGCILLLNEVSDQWKDLFSMIADLRIPTAIIDEFGHWRVRDYFPSSGKVRVFSFSVGRMAAARITRVLLNYGHRHCAFISPYSSFSWSVLRREAIREELSHAGLGGNLACVELDIDKEVSLLIPDLSGRKVYRFLVEALRRFPGTIQGAYARHNSPGTWRDNIIEEAVEQLLHDRLKPLCARSDITAWIAVNDASAVIASRVLGECVSPSADVSLVSFDNSPDAQNLRIASYDFNAAGCVSAVLNFIMSSFDSRASFPTERFEIPGTLVERASLRPARSPSSAGNSSNRPSLLRAAIPGSDPIRNFQSTAPDPSPGWCIFEE